MALHQPFPLHCILSSTWYTPLLTLKGNYCMSRPVLRDLSQSKPVVSCIEPCLTVSTLPVDRTEALGVCSAGACIDVGICMCVCLHVWVWMWTGNVVYCLYRQLLSKKASKLSSDWFGMLYISSNSMHHTNSQVLGRLDSQLIMLLNPKKKKKKSSFFIMCRFNFLVVTSIPGDWWIQEYKCSLYFTLTLNLYFNSLLFSMWPCHHM